MITEFLCKFQKQMVVREASIIKPLVYLRRYRKGWMIFNIPGICLWVSWNMVRVTATEKIYYNFTKVETWDANGGFIWPVLKLLSSCGT